MVANRSTKRGEGRAELIAAATRLIATKGMHAFSMVETAEEADVSRGSITYHFETHRQVIEVALSEHADTCTAISAAAVSSAENQPRGRALDSLCLALLHIYGDRVRALMCAELRISAVREPLARAAHNQTDTAVNALLVAVHKLTNRSSAPADIQTAADGLNGEVLRCALRHTAEKQYRAAIRRYLHGIYR